MTPPCKVPGGTATPCHAWSYESSAATACNIHDGSGLLRGAPIGVQRLPNAFPGTAFAEALPLLQELGSHFHLHQVTARRYVDYHGYVEGMRIEVTSLYCLICSGFEVLLRCTQANDFDPALQSSDSDRTINDDD